MSSDIIDFRAERNRHQRFIGREALFAELDRRLLRGEGACRWVLIQGSPGLGKSAILARYLQRLEKEGWQVPHHFLRQSVGALGRPEVVARNLAAQVERQYRMQPDLQAPPELRLLQVLQRVSDEDLSLAEGNRLILIIDGLDEAESPVDGRNPLPRFLPEVLPSGVHVLCASRPRYPHLDWLKARNEGLHIVDLDSEASTQSNEEVVRGYWNGEIAAARFDPPLAPALIEEAVRRARGNVLYTVKLAQWLREQPPERRRVELLPQGLEGFLKGIWNQLLELPEADRQLALEGVGLIAAAREALPRDVLEAVAGWKGPVTWERFLQATRPLLLEEPDWLGGREKESAWRLFHESFRELIIKRLGREQERQEHQRLAECFGEWPVKEGSEGFRRRYTLRHGVTHCLVAGREERARSLCMDVSYLEAKCQEQGVTAVEDELALVAGGAPAPLQAPLRALHETVRFQSHWLRQNPGALGQLVYNGLRCAGWEQTRIEESLRFPDGLPIPRLRHPVRMYTGVLRTLKGHKHDVNGCAVTADGKRAVSACEDGTLKVWDLETGQEQATLKGHAGWVRGCAVTADGKRAVSASEDGTLKVWDLETGQEQATLKGHAHGVFGCAVTADGKRVVSACEDGTLKVWDLETGQEQATLKGHKGTVFGCAVTADGKRAVSASEDGTLKVWDLQTGQEQATLKGHEGTVFGCAVTADGKRAVSASEDGTLKVWDLETGQEQSTLKGHADWVRGCAVTADGKRAVSASEDGTLKVWDLETGQEQATLKGHEGTVFGCAVTADGKRAVSASEDGTLKVWDLETGQEQATLKGHEGIVFGCAVTVDGRRALSACEDRTLKVWDLETGQAQATLKGHEGIVFGCAVTADGKRAVSASSDGTLKVWDLETGQAQATLKGHEHGVNGCAVTADGKRAVSACEEGTLKVWDLETGQEQATLKGHEGTVFGCAVAADGKRAVSACEDGTLKVWDLQSGACEQTVYGKGGFASVAGARDFICAGDVHGELWILDTAPAKKRLPEPRPLDAHGVHAGSVSSGQEAASSLRGRAPRSKAKLDLGIVVALPEEFRVLQELLPTGWMHERDRQTGQIDYLFELPDSLHRCVATLIGEMNPEPAAIQTARLIDKWNPRAVAMLGIAAGIHPDVKVGDVIVASQVDDYQASAKAQPGALPGSYEWALGGTVYHGDHDLLTGVRNFEFTQKDALTSWRHACEAALVKLVSDEERKTLIKQEWIRAAPEIRDVHLASGKVVGSAEGFIQWLRERRDRNHKALDMESAGLMAAAIKRAGPKRTLVIRGISDAGNKDKALLDALGEGALRRYAMHNATMFLWTLMKVGVLPRASR